MINHRKKATCKSIVLAVSAAVLMLTGPLTFADSGMHGGHGMMSDSGGQMMMHREMHNGMKGFGPHNAAEHFLTMKTSLDLTDDQIKQLRKLRDDYLKDNATTEKHVSDAYGDLPNLLYADEVDMTAANDLIDKTAKLETQLWHAYTKQLHDIKAILTPEQKKALSDSWEKAHGGMGRRCDDGEMPMHDDEKPSH